VNLFTLRYIVVGFGSCFSKFCVAEHLDSVLRFSGRLFSPGPYNKRGNMSFTRNPGRFAGLLYLLLSLPGFFAMVYVPGKLIV
jgi:hypothetical protein